MEGIPLERRVLITGATGSLGSALIKAFTQDEGYYRVSALSRDPHKQGLMRLVYPQVNYILGDVRNRDLMLDLCGQNDIVIHAAAMKVVSDADKNVKEAMSINTLGTLNIAEACRLNSVEKALFISSDKASNGGSTTYGQTKSLAERLWLAENSQYHSTKLSVLRYGNVISSNGSVIHVWKQRLEQGLPIIVKYPEPTRFVLHMDQAVMMVLKSLEIIRGNEIFIPGKVPTFSVWDLAREFAPESEWIKEPLLPTERQHEYMIGPTEYAEPITNDFLGINLWRIDNNKTPYVYEIPPLFSSQEARRISGKEVIELINKQ